MKISDRKEFANKAPPLTCQPDSTVFDAVRDMSEKNFGSVIVTDGERRVLGIMSERDIFRRVIAEERDPKTTLVSEVMTTDVRTAKADDELLDWLRIMSNERFRRLPIVDDDNRLTNMMSQGDFVSYTWPQLLGQLNNFARASIAPIFNPVTIGLSILVYTVVIILVLSIFI